MRAATREGDRETIRLAATRLAARCLGALPDAPTDIQKVSTEVRLLGVLARQQGVEDELPPASPISEAEPPAAEADDETGDEREFEPPTGPARDALRI